MRGETCSFGFLVRRLAQGVASACADGKERHGREWRPNGIDGDLTMGRAHHAIYFLSPEAWQGYPEWARHRRDKIIARIKSEFREPDYTYHGDEPTGTPPKPPQSAALPSKPAAPAPPSVITEPKGNGIAFAVW